MQLFPIGRVYDFMRMSKVFISLSVLMIIGSFVLLFYPGPRLGPDFVGGTEVEVAFEKPVSVQDIRTAVQRADFSVPEVIRVEDGDQPHRYLIRVPEVSSIADAQQREIEKRLCFGEKKPEGCTEHASEVKFSPGGEKITVRYEGPPNLEWTRSQLEGLPGIKLRPGEHNPVIQDVRDHRVEIALLGRGDQLMGALRTNLGAGAVPEHALRMEWIGPKAGAQLRDAAVQSALITIVLIMAYITLRFDLRFAPGSVVALIHDSVVTLGVLIVLGREVNLTTLAAILTIIGYSVNDTVVVFDRVRENLGKMRGASFTRLINVSLSEMLGRTILTSSAAIMVLLCFFIWGTGTLRDFALTLIIGFLLGIYSTIYIALPLADFFDRKIVAKAKSGA